MIFNSSRLPPAKKSYEIAEQSEVAVITPGISSKAKIILAEAVCGHGFLNRIFVSLAEGKELYS